MFADDWFDTITAFETVYFWPDLPRCFREVYRCLLYTSLADVHFSYAPGRETLHGVSVVFPDRGMTAIVGESGCGKTTAAKLLTCLLYTSMVKGKDEADYEIISADNTGYMCYSYRFRIRGLRCGY